MTKIIAEIASSHNGDLEMAKALIASAAKNGADLVKFQDWKAKNVKKDDPDKKRYEQYEFKDEWYPILIDYCKKLGVEFLTSCFNADRIEFLAGLGLKKIKIASVSLTNTELLMMAGANFEEVIVSTAMHNEDEVNEAIDLLSSNTQHFTLMHCVANYPTLPGDANLERIDRLKDMLGGVFGDGWKNYCSVGYSDHSLDLEISKIALAKGIKYLEKHFTLDRRTPQMVHRMYKEGPAVTTHEISIEPKELKELADWRDWVTAVHGPSGEGSKHVEHLIRDRYSNRYGE